jgi:WXG100 family type VII secretion target
MAEKTECNYDELQQLTKMLQKEAEEMNQLLSQTRGKADALHGDGWIGRGADKFFAEMQQLILPSMTRLVNALNQASQSANQISEIYRQAEDEAQNGFKTVSF